GRRPGRDRAGRRVLGHGRLQAPLRAGEPRAAEPAGVPRAPRGRAAVLGHHARRPRRDRDRPARGRAPEAGRRPGPGTAVRRGAGGPLLLGLALLLVLSITLAVTIGPSDVGARDAWQVVAGHLGIGTGASPTTDAIVWEIRLPRVLLAGAVGAGLALVGAVLQATMRNPLADPYLLGISAGASFGAVIVFVGIGGAAVGLTTGAFGGAMAAFAGVVVLGAGRGARLDP